MYERSGLDHFKKAETLEPFSINTNSATKSTTSVTTNAALRSTALINHPETSYPQTNYLNQHNILQKKTWGLDIASTAVPTRHITQLSKLQQLLNT